MTGRTDRGFGAGGEWICEIEQVVAVRPSSGGWPAIFLIIIIISGGLAISLCVLEQAIVSRAVATTKLVATCEASATQHNTEAAAPSANLITHSAS